MQQPGLAHAAPLAGDESQEPPAVLDACQAASMRNVAAMGPHAGRPLRKIVLRGWRGTIGWR